MITCMLAFFMSVVVCVLKLWELPRLKGIAAFRFNLKFRPVTEVNI